MKTFEELAGKTVTFLHTTGEQLTGRVCGISPAKNSIDNQVRITIYPVDNTWFGAATFVPEIPLYPGERNVSHLIILD